jgi:uncharacterized protein (TIGR00255 family)
VLLSMTGYGSAQGQADDLRASVEIRTVNNRHLKISTRCTDQYASLQRRIEQVLRDSIARGTIMLTVDVRHETSSGLYSLDRDLITTYWNELTALATDLGAAPPSDVSALLDLPGVVAEEREINADTEAAWPLIDEVLGTALEQLQVFRTEEGRSMQVELESITQEIANNLDKISLRAPEVVRDYRDRMHERVSELLQERGVELGSSDLIREVSIFADRCDINEEITRLRSHLEQFSTFLCERTSQGRKLDFLSQEMFREVNTIGSKANCIDIAHDVVDMKAGVEKIREILANVE